jgi:hypothetical protein
MPNASSDHLFSIEIVLLDLDLVLLHLLFFKIGTLFSLEPVQRRFAPTGSIRVAYATTLIISPIYAAR